MDKYKHSVPARNQGHLYSATSIGGGQFSATSIEGDQLLGTLEPFPDSQYFGALAEEKEEYLETSNEQNFGSPPMLHQDNDTDTAEAELEAEVSLEEQVSEKIFAQAHNGCFFSPSLEFSSQT